MWREGIKLRGHTNHIALSIIGSASIQFSSFEDYLVALSEECARRNISHVIVYPAKPRNIDYLNELERVRAKIVVIPNNGLFAFTREFSQLLKIFRPQIVHSHFGRTVFAATALSHLFGVRGIFITRHFMSGDECTRRHKSAYKWIGSLSKCIFCVSPLVYDELVKMGISATRLQTVPLGVNSEKFRCISDYKTRKKEICHEFGIASSESLIVSTSHFREGKGLDILIEAVPKVLADCPNTTFILAGNGPLLHHLRAKCLSLGVEEKVVFAGLRQNILGLLVAADVFVLTSLSEGMSSSVLEAIAAENPVVATPVGSVPCIVRSGENGFIVKKRDPVDVARALKVLLKEQDLRKAMGKKGREMIERKFNMVDKVDKIVDFYEQSMSEYS